MFFFVYFEHLKGTKGYDKQSIHKMEEPVTFSARNKCGRHDRSQDADEAPLNGTNSCNKIWQNPYPKK